MRKGQFILGALDESDVSWLRSHGKLEELDAGSDLSGSITGKSRAWLQPLVNFLGRAR